MTPIGQQPTLSGSPRVQIQQPKAVIRLSHLTRIRRSQTDGVHGGLSIRSNVHHILIHAVTDDVQEYPAFESTQIDTEPRVERVRRIKQSKVLIDSVSLYVCV